MKSYWLVSWLKENLVPKYFWVWITSYIVIFLAQISNIWWFQFLKCKDFGGFWLENNLQFIDDEKSCGPIQSSKDE